MFDYDIVVCSKMNTVMIININSSFNNYYLPHNVKSINNLFYESLCSSAFRIIDFGCGLALIG